MMNYEKGIIMLRINIFYMLQFSLKQRGIPHSEICIL